MDEKLKILRWDHQKDMTSDMKNVLIVDSLFPFSFEQKNFLKKSEGDDDDDQREKKKGKITHIPYFDGSVLKKNRYDLLVLAWEPNLQLRVCIWKKLFRDVLPDYYNFENMFSILTKKKNEKNEKNEKNKTGGFMFVRYRLLKKKLKENGEKKEEKERLQIINACVKWAPSWHDPPQKDIKKKYKAKKQEQKKVAPSNIPNDEYDYDKEQYELNLIQRCSIQ